MIKRKIKCGMCGNVREESIFGFDFYSQWDSFKFWEKMNWRDFTVINLRFETNSYSKYLELEIAILGLNFNFDIYRPFSEISCTDCFKKKYLIKKDK